MKKITDQVVNSATAKDLKEAGLKQESIFYWQNDNLLYAEQHKITEGHSDSIIPELFSAFLPGELILPSYIKKEGRFGIHRDSELDYFLVGYGKETPDGFNFGGKAGENLAQVIGDELLWLIEHDRVKIKDGVVV